MRRPCRARGTLRAPMPRTACLVVLAIAVLAASAALRLTGLDWQLPKIVEPDAHIPVQVRQLETSAAAPERTLDWGAYPHLVAQLTRLLTPREDRSPPPGELALPAQLARAQWPVLRVRLIVALLSILAIPATFLLARLWLPAGWSLLAAALSGTSLLAVHFAAQARAHGAAAGLMALAVLACVRLRRRGDAASYALAGLCVGAAIGCLQSGVATLLPLAVAHVGVVREHGRRRHALLLLPLLCVAIAVVAFYPFLFQASAGADGARLGIDGSVLQQSKHRVYLELFRGVGFFLLGRALWNWEPALTLGAACGAIVWLLTRRRPTSLAARPGDRLVVLSFVMSYALAIGLYQRSYERFLLPLLPFLAVLAAWGVARICEAVRAAGARRALAVLLVVPMLGFPATVAARLVALRLQPDTPDVAAAWIEEHVEPAGPRIVTSRYFALPLFRTRLPQDDDSRHRLDDGLDWLSYERVTLRAVSPSPAWHLQWIPFANDRELRASLQRGVRAWVASLPGEWCVNDVWTDERGVPPLAAITTALRVTSERLARISPDGDAPAWEAGLGYQDEIIGSVPPMAWRVLHARRFGPVVEIYRLAQPGDPAGAR